MTEFENRKADWLPFSEALDRLLGSAGSMGTEEVPLGRAPGRVLAEAVVSPLTLPQHDNSAMDGYATREEDVAGAGADRPAELRVVGVARPGAPWEGRLSAGEAVRIMTGGPIPDGADGVIRVEDTDREEAEEGFVRILADRDRGRHVRPRGEDVREGETVLRPGTTVGSGTVALLAALGVARLRVRRSPTVAILSTGDELVDASGFRRVLAGRATADSNGPALAAGLRGAGCTPLPLGIVPDDEEALERAIRSAMKADALLTAGGASMGEGDLVKRVLDRMGFHLEFWRIRARPGTPFGFGLLPRKEIEPLPVLGLPGNPVSAFVTFEALVRPFVLSLGGHERIGRPLVRARAGDRLRGHEGFRQFLRVHLDPEEGGEWTARLTGPQGSGLVRSIGVAHGLAVVPEDVAEVAPGDDVEVMLLGEGPGWHGSPIPRP